MYVCMYVRWVGLHTMTMLYIRHIYNDISIKQKFRLRRRYTIRFARAEPADCPVHGPIVMCSMSPECSGPMKIGLKGIRPRSIIKPILSHLLCDNPIRAQ